MPNPVRSTASADDDALRAAVEQAVAEHFPGTVTEFRRRPSAYRTSFALEELDVTFSSGERMTLIFKDLSRHSLGPAEPAKPAAVYDPLREIEIYRSLTPLDLGTAKCYGAVADAAAGRYWLFLEKVAG